ncbi:hypothetical protein M405DRAFT_870306 [Rhizopogon salebrosus TDB-379]|nr:hypothetical protein M405DRAFT_870306 [Rhizopogon salebrosus TDB-379]
MSRRVTIWTSLINTFDSKTARGPLPTPINITVPTLTPIPPPGVPLPHPPTPFLSN